MTVLMNLYKFVCPWDYLCWCGSLAVFFLFTTWYAIWDTLKYHKLKKNWLKFLACLLASASSLLGVTYETRYERGYDSNFFLWFFCTTCYFFQSDSQYVFLFVSYWHVCRFVGSCQLLLFKTWNGGSCPKICNADSVSHHLFFWSHHMFMHSLLQILSDACCWHHSWQILARHFLTPSHDYDFREEY